MKKPKLPKIVNRKGRRNGAEAGSEGVNANFAAANFSADFASSSGASAVSFGTSGASYSPSGMSRSLAYEDNSDGFDVNVRNAESGIRLLDERNRNPWILREMPHELATAISLMSAFTLMLAAAGVAAVIPFLLAGVAVYMALVFIEEKLDSRVRLFAAAGVFVVLVATVIILRRYILGGAGLVMNAVYDSSEATQAYIYDRLDIGATADEHPVMCVRALAVWVSVLVGMLAALPPAAARRAIGLAAAAVAMIVFAYYGIIPATACIAIIVAALVFVLSRGGLPAALPVLLASLLIFGVIMLINPGENYGISRADENFRDRFALHSAYLQNEMNPDYQDEMNDPFEERDEYDSEAGDITSSHKWLVPLIIAVLVIGGLGAAFYFLYRRYRMRRAANREGIDSDDPRTAIVAMFPYAIRWLGAADIDVAGRSFASLVEPLRHDVSDQYSNYFSSMYVLWREAAYSDHEMAEDKRAAMKEFLNDTTDMVKRDLDWRGKLKAAFKYAL